jgi:predicted ATP-dependent endonuclease of OLD family
MKLRHLIVKNFRALKQVEIDFVDGVNVIVGPNAIGKTTILEAVRLAKALLAPRTQNEGLQTLMSLGAVSPHAPQQLMADNLVQDVSIPLEVRCEYKLCSEEVETLSNSLETIVSHLVQSRTGGQVNPANFVAFSSSPQGKSLLLEARKEVIGGLEKIQAANGDCNLHLVIDFNSNRIDSKEPLDAAFIGHLDRLLPPSLTIFSYFPADRALPRGEHAVQIGAQDAVQQIESHNSQPSLKYGRLKNTIFNTVIEGQDGRQLLQQDFETIFSGLLKGRELVAVGVGPQGQLTIRIKDKASGRQFDIDGLSSGEKGLILTFLLLSRTVADGGVVLLDEPELHLNPAVCKHMLDFMMDSYVSRKSLQLILCSHSAEILAGAFARDECAVYHVVSEKLVTKVRHSDAEEISEILRLLGTSESEALLYKATIFVEGATDIEILESGFGSLLRQYKIKDLGGRKEIEKHIKNLQDAESKGEPLSERFFIFDRDNTPSRLESRGNIKVLQWDRTCLENYLIDVDAITDLLRDEDLSLVKFRNLGETNNLLRELAMSQLQGVVAQMTYSSYGYGSLGTSPAELHGKDFGACASYLFDRIASLQTQIGSAERNAWKQNFEDASQARLAELKPIWEARWNELCDGKKLFHDFQAVAKIRVSPIQFKKRLIMRMRNPPQSGNWRQLESLLSNLLSSGDGRAS